jgi:hypothetical protein
MLCVEDWRGVPAIPWEQLLVYSARVRAVLPALIPAVASERDASAVVAEVWAAPDAASAKSAEKALRNQASVRHRLD